MNCGLPAHSPMAQTLGRGRLQPLVDADVAARVQLDAGLVEADPGGVRHAPGRHQDVAALDVLLAGGRAHDKADALAGSAVHLEGLGRQQNLDAFVAENPLHLIRDVRILAAP